MTGGRWGRVALLVTIGGAAALGTVSMPAAGAVGAGYGCDVAANATPAAGDMSIPQDVSDDGDRMAFWSKADINGENPEGLEAIWIYEHSSESTHLVYAEPDPGQSLVGTVISGNGSTVALFSVNLLQTRVYVVDVDHPESPLLIDPGAGSIAGAAIDYAGDTVAYLKADDDLWSSWDAYLWELDGDPVQLTENPDSELSFDGISLSGDGSTVALDVRLPDGSWDDLGYTHEIRFFDAGGGDLSEATIEDAGGPILDGDGSRVAYSLHPSDVGASTQVADVGGDVLWTEHIPRAFDFSPDGDLVLTNRRTSISTGRSVALRGPFPEFPPPQPIIPGGFVWAMSEDGRWVAAGPELDALLLECGDFGDVAPSHPFADDITWLDEQGISAGFPDGDFRPAAAVTRQSMSAFLYRLAGEPAVTPPPEPTFRDVPETHTFFAEVEWMASEAITTGFPGGLFKPAHQVTRQSMSAFLHRLAEGPGVGI